MASATTPGAVRRALTTRLAALTPEAGYRQFAEDDAAWRGVWRVSTDALENAPSVRAHLSFFFDDSETESMGQSRINVAEGYLVSCPVTLRFLYRIRPENEVEDWDAAADAALHAMRDLVNWALTDADVNLAPMDGLAILRTQIENSPWLLVEVAFTADYYLSLTL